MDYVKEILRYEKEKKELEVRESSLEKIIKERDEEILVLKKELQKKESDIIQYKYEISRLNYRNETRTR